MSPKTSSHRRPLVLQHSNKKREVLFHVLGKARRLSARLLRVTTPLTPPLLRFLGHRLASDLSPLCSSPEASPPTQSHTANSYWGRGAGRPTVGLHMTNSIIYWSLLLMRFPQPFSTLGMSHWPFFLLSLNLFSFSRSQSSIPQISFPTPHEYLCFLLWLFLVFNM